MADVHDADICERLCCPSEIKKKKHGELPVDQVFQRAGNRIIIQRKTPYGNVRPEQILDDLTHIILYKALSGGAVPAGKAAETGPDIQLI